MSDGEIVIICLIWVLIVAAFYALPKEYQEKIKKTLSWREMFGCEIAGCAGCAVIMIIILLALILIALISPMALLPN